MQIAEVQKYVGHAKITTTMAYIQTAEKGTIIKSMIERNIKASEKVPEAAPEGAKNEETAQKLGKKSQRSPNFLED
jgi:hypothetical protein